MSDFRTLKAWEKAHALTLEIYTVTRAFPSDERYGLSSQLRRAAVSVGSNLAEGTGKNTVGEMRQAFGHALGSVHEIQYQLLVGRDLGYIPAQRYAALEPAVREIRAMLDALRRSV